MPNVLRGMFTINEVLNFTYQYYRFRNRFDYRDRDVVKRIIIKKVKRFQPDRVGEPLILYIIESRSWPQYRPYFNPKTGRKYQRKVKHEYDITLELDSLSINYILEQLMNSPFF